MKRLEFNEKNNLTDVLKALQKEPGHEIEIYLFPGSDILKDSANKEIIELLAKDLNKKVVLKGDVGVKTASKDESKGEVKAEDDHGFVEGKDVAEDQIEGKNISEAKKKRFSFPKLPKLKFLKGPKWIYFGVGLLGFIVVGGILTFWLVPRATVTLITEQKFKESELAIVASAKEDEVDVDKGIIPLKTMETTVKDVLEQKATGSKTVGTSAKGRIKIINRETSDKKFFSGTEIKTISGPSLSFTLDSVATISASVEGCTNDCKETAVNVTAKQIGADSNLKSGTKFKVGSVVDTTKVVGESLVNFSGGSSKKITIVSADDQKKVKEELLEKLETKAKEELETENPEIVIPEGGLEGEIVNETYDKKIGEEASDIKLSLEVKFSVKIFSEDDLKNILIDSISDSIPSGFEVDKEGSSVESEILEKGDDNLKVLGKIKANLIPIIQTSDIAKNIAGKDFGSTDKYLKAIDAITGFEIKLEPSIMRLFGTMPFASNRIKIKVIQEE